MVDFKRYLETCFRPLDVIGTTSYGPLARAIWRNTWARRRPFAFIFGCWYRGRAGLATHNAITCVNNCGKPCLMEMDTSQRQKRYVGKTIESVLLPEEYAKVEHSCSNLYDAVEVYSGVYLTSPEKYFATTIRDNHVCWIGRCPSLKDGLLQKGNNWLFDKY